MKYLQVRFDPATTFFSSTEITEFPIRGKIHRWIAEAKSTDRISENEAMEAERLSLMLEKELQMSEDEHLMIHSVGMFYSLSSQ